MNNTATVPQARHLLQMLETLTSDQAQRLISSGLFADFLRCATESDLTKVDRGDFQTVLGLERFLFTVKMGGYKTTNKIVGPLSFPVDDEIVQRNFPIFPLGYNENSWEDDIELVDPQGFSQFDDRVSDKEVFKIFEDRGLKRPRYEHAIRFAEQCGKMTTSEKKPFIIFLHEPREINGRLYLLSFDRRPKHLGLGFHLPVDSFTMKCVFAGVRPRKQPQV